MKLRVGVVGLGDQWEGRQLPALRALSDRFAVRAICSAVGERARAAAKEFDADVSDGFRAVVERDDIDVILALSPEWYGPLPILAACDAGKAVYSSAALDLSPDEAAELHQRVEASGIAFMAELPRRHSPATIRLKELIATRLGRPRLMFCHERLPIESGTSRGRQGDHCSLAWRNLMELVDWCRYVVEADPESVISAAHTSCDTGPARFYQMLSLDFPAESVSPNEQNPNEAARPIAQISTGHYIPETWRDAMSFNRPASLQICCENGMAFIDRPFEFK